MCVTMGTLLKGGILSYTASLPARLLLARVGDGSFHVLPSFLSIEARVRWSATARIARAKN